MINPNVQRLLPFKPVVKEAPKPPLLPAAPTFFVVGGNLQVLKMFVKRGWVPVKELALNPDVLVFTGGADVSPSYYNQSMHKTTNVNEKRDEEEAEIFCEHEDKFKIGICRGAQLLNVMSGGSLWQNVNNHTDRHMAWHKPSEEMVEVTSTHHQMMRATNKAEILMTARLATLKESDKLSMMGSEFLDVECVWYEASKSFCFQPHPEYGHKATEQVFFDTIDYLRDPDRKRV